MNNKMPKEILCSYKFRIYPDKDQKQKLNQTFGCVRFVWNKLVENFNNYNSDKFDPDLNEQKLKRKSDNQFLYDVSNCALQQKIRDFTETKRQFFNQKRKKRLGRMNFKVRKNKQSYRLTNICFRLDQQESKIRLEKIGYIPYVKDREIPEDADLRSVTVSKTPTGKYFISILVKQQVEQKPLTGRKVGIDLGLKELFNLSNGTKVDNHRWFRENQAELSVQQRHLSRKMKGSNRYEKQRLKVTRLHEKIANQRSYFLHNMTIRLVRAFDVIYVEDLNVEGMKRNSRLSKSVSDAGWSEFVRQLQYKCDWYGKTLVKVDQWFPSSQICSSCGSHEGKKNLSVREWSCSNCHDHHDRDLNAALNILKRGYSDLTGITWDETSAELVDNKRGEDISLFDASHHLATSVKR